MQDATPTNTVVPPQPSGPVTTAPPAVWSGAMLLRSPAFGIVLLAAALLFSELAGAPAYFQLLSDCFTLMFPAEAFDVVLNALKYWAKPFLLINRALVWLGLGVSVAVMAAAALRRLPNSSATDRLNAPGRCEIGLVVAAAAAPFLFGELVVAPVSGVGLFATQTFAGSLRVAFAGLLASAAYGVALFRAYAAPPAEGVPRGQAAHADPLARPGLARRDFMLLSGTTLMGAVGGAILGKDVTGLLARAKGTGTAAAATPDPNLRGDIDVTTVDTFYVVSKNFGDPELDSFDWRLKVEGKAEKPLSLSLDDIKALPTVREYITLECISNEVGGDLIGCGRWTGVPLADVPRPKADTAWVSSSAADGYTESLPFDDALAGRVMLVYELNGQPLITKHGHPLRLLYPGHYGMKSTKWITKMELARMDVPGYWEERGWDEQAVVLTRSKINYPPQATEVIRRQHIQVRGVAFAGARGIKRVEVSTDEEKTWHPAQPKPPLSAYSWTLWTYTWLNAAPGFQRVTVRSMDGRGEVQSVNRAGTYPRGGTGYHSVQVQVL